VAADGTVELCAAEGAPRAPAFAEMIVGGHFDAAEVMAANVERIVRVHLDEHELRRGAR
jgi:hypothetical protein